DDELVQGEITAQQTAQFYSFFARADDLVSVRMDRISGSLDTYLILLDENLIEIAVNDDGGGGQNAALEQVRLPRTGIYYVRATRFEGDDGTTVGRYRISLERRGGAFDDIIAAAQPILYGSTVTGVVNEETPETLYAFFGTQGDVVTIGMNRGDGNLDPFVAVLGENLQPLSSDDDSGGGQNARIERFVLGRTGVYYIRASRYTGPEGPSDTHGSFILVLAQVGG
ncbi:MAG: PPC domain-containing protein, partial [Chloroflexota bacterium]